MTDKYWECNHYKATGVTDESGKYWDGPGLCDLNDKFCVMEGDMPCEIFEEEKAEEAGEAMQRLVEEEAAADAYRSMQQMAEATKEQMEEEEAEKAMFLDAMGGRLEDYDSEGSLR